MDRSLHRLGQLLVVMGALLGAITGVTLALLVENAETSGAAVPERERAAVLAAPSPSSQPPAAQAASSENPADANHSFGSQRAEQADQRNGRADNNGQGHHDKPGKGKDKPGKGR